MSDRGRYTAALEKRLEWYQWGKRFAPELYKELPPAMVRLYEHALGSDTPTYFMNDRFCQLTDHARRTIPDDLAFDPQWLASKEGWMWLEEPFVTPPMTNKPEGVSDLRVSAIAWFPVKQRVVSGREKLVNSDGRVLTQRDIDEGVYIMTYMDRHLANPEMRGYGMWSYFVLLPGEKVIDKVRAFENMALTCDDDETVRGAYVTGRAMDMLHEVRWVYTAFHLMSQRLATTVEHKAERATVRRVERENLSLPPLLRVVTLRRMEEARHAEGGSHAVDWKWQWDVRGHWRNQYYPGTGEHKPKYIEEYTKGPPDAPFKPPAALIYQAKR